MPLPLGEEDAGGHHRRMILGLLLVAVLMRGWIVWSGGQFFWPDEGRYESSRTAVAMMASGRIGAGLASTVAQGDHVGFKLLGLVPAAFERLTGITDPRFAAGFFALFSCAVPGLLWQCARRIGLPAPAQVWTVFLAVASGSLLPYARHLLPYDTSLALGLSAVLVGWRRSDSWRRSFAAGLLAGAAVLVYFGYWLLGGVAVLLVAGRQPEGMVRRALRLMTVAVGALVPALAVWLLDRWGDGTMVENARKFSGSINQGDFGHGYQLIGEYYWYAEGPLVLLVWLFSIGWLLREIWVARRVRRPLPVAVSLILIAVVVTLGGLIMGSDALHKFVVYGRTARQVTPFLCLGSGLALAGGMPAGRRGLILARWVGWALAASFAWRVTPVLTQVFPPAFQLMAKREIDRLTPRATDEYYYYANLDHYFETVDAPPAAPVRILLSARHPFEYQPYLYEGFDARTRAQRRAADHRMVVALMKIPEQARVAGEPHGTVHLQVRFTAGRAGRSEPLLSLGDRDTGELFFIRYTGDRQFVPGLEIIGMAGQEGAPVEFDPERTYDLEIFSGALAPPSDQPVMDPAVAQHREFYQYLFLMKLDGREILRGLSEHRPTSRDSTYAGLNVVQATSAGREFSGVLTGAQCGGFPVDVATLDPPVFGAVRFRLVLPATPSGQPEPLVAMGLPGKATLGYIRPLPGGKIRLGVEFWGFGVVESEILPVTGNGPVEVTLGFPALYPPVGDARWRAVPRTVQQDSRSTVVATLNGREVLRKKVTSPPPVPFYTTIGRNEFGGTWVTSAFTGQIAEVVRLPFAPGPD